VTAERHPSPARAALTRTGRALAAGAMRAEHALAARPAAWAIRLALLYTVFALLVLTPTFESNDDVGMMFIADGTFYGTPQPHLVFQHPVVGVVLATLYGWTTSVNWYAAWLYGLHAAALAVFLYLVFADTRTRLLARLVPLAGFGSVFITWMWLNLQFTAVAITVGAAGVLLFSSLGARARLPAAVPLLAGALVGVSAFVRWRSFQAVLLLAIPVLVAGARRIPWRRHAWFGATILVVVLSGGAFQTLYYAGDDAWHDYFEFNSVRGAIHSTERMTEARDPETLAALGWSRADYDMFRSWFYLDEDLYSTERLELLVDEVGLPLRHPTAVLDLADGLDRFVRLAVLGGLLVAAWAVSDRRSGLVLAATTIWFIVVVTALAMAARLPDRIAVPMLAYLGMIYLIRPHAAFGDRYDPPPVWAGRAALGVVIATSLVAFGVAWPRTAADSARWNRHNDAFIASMHELAEVDPGGVFVSWGGSAGTLRVSPELAERVPVTLLPLGWHQRSPMHTGRLAELGIDDLYDAIATDERVYLTLAADEPEARWYVAYMAQHYGYTGFLRPTASVDVDGRLTVYDLLIASYSVDDDRGVLVEVRGDGAQVELPIVRHGVAGTFSASPEGRLVGWAVDIETLRPVDRIVVTRDGRLVEVLATAYLRPGEAAAHGLAEDARIGFVLGDLDGAELAEARVFAVRSDSAVELIRGTG